MFDASIKTVDSLLCCQNLHASHFRLALALSSTSHDQIELFQAPTEQHKRRHFQTEKLSSITLIYQDNYRDYCFLIKNFHNFKMTELNMIRDSE